MSHPIFDVLVLTVQYYYYLQVGSMIELGNEPIDHAKSFDSKRRVRNRGLRARWVYV